jgi:hypothetical protein
VKAWQRPECLYSSGTWAFDDYWSDDAQHNVG